MLCNRSFCRIENGWKPHFNALILGDPAYSLKQWLISPTYQNPAQINSNRAHKRTSRLTENSFGILKEKFPCFNHLRVDPVLHQIFLSEAVEFVVRKSRRWRCLRWRKFWKPRRLSDETQDRTHIFFWKKLPLLWSKYVST